jgi:hypothetical protein
MGTQKDRQIHSNNKKHSWCEQAHKREVYRKKHCNPPTPPPLLVRKKKKNKRYSCADYFSQQKEKHNVCRTRRGVDGLVLLASVLSSK